MEDDEDDDDDDDNEEDGETQWTSCRERLVRSGVAGTSSIFSAVDDAMCVGGAAISNAEAVSDEEDDEDEEMEERVSSASSASIVENKEE